MTKSQLIENSGLPGNLLQCCQLFVLFFFFCVSQNFGQNFSITSSRWIFTSMATVEVKVLLSYTHPLWHPPTGRLAPAEMLSRSCIWGSVNILQESDWPSSPSGMLTISICSWDKFLTSSELASELRSQWWGGVQAMKLLSRKCPGVTMRGMLSISKTSSW